MTYDRELLFTYVIFFSFFLFWPCLSDPIACSFLGVGSTPHNSGYMITWLCPYLCYFCYYFISSSVLSNHCPSMGVTLSPHSNLLHLTCLIASTPPLCLGPHSIPIPSPTLTPTPRLSLPLPPSSLSPPSLFWPDSTTAETRSLLASKWPAHRGTELVSLKYTARQCYASLWQTFWSHWIRLAPLPPPMAGNPRSRPPVYSVASQWYVAQPCAGIYSGR